ncbi:MAG: hypothetical protein HC815_26925 [Richelia sp. RM1_1_1]|nr:hypothetical protein [Richelia sp. RM1_1_1]
MSRVHYTQNFLDLLHNIEERRCELVRISDCRQILVNRVVSDLFKQSGRQLLQINTCDMWEAADVEELDKQVWSGVDEF